MTKPTITVHNTETNQIIEREMDDTEFAQWEKDQSEAAAILETEAEAKSKKHQAEEKLAALGITTADLRALGL